MTGFASTAHAGLAVHAVQVDVPAQHYDATVAFWATALAATPVRVVPGRFTHLAGASGAVGVHLQRLDDGAAGYHLDLAADDLEAQRLRAVALGATEVGAFDGGHTFHDPAGLAFCLVAGSADDGLTRQPPGRAYLTGGFVDVPGHLVDTELGFWSALLDAPIVPTDEPERYIGLAGLTGPVGPLLFEVQRIADDDRPRMHVDLAAADVAAEAARLESLGATRVGQVENWVVLRDPSDHLFCVVPSHA